MKFLTVLITFGCTMSFVVGTWAGAMLNEHVNQPKNLWSLCKASPSIIWKSGSLQVRQNTAKHDYSCIMSLDGQGNILPVKVYKGGTLVASRLTSEALRDPALNNAELAAEMSSL